jgi:hypothetical protein
MRIGSQRGLFVLVASSLLVGCFEETSEQRSRAVCNAYCECFVTAGEVQQCVVEECLPDLPPVSDECLDCVISNSQTCTALGAQCTDTCFDNGTP